MLTAAVLHAWLSVSPVGPAALQGAQPHARAPAEVESPLPGGLAEVVRFFLSSVPQWIQIGGAVVGVLVAGWAVAYAWKRRTEILGWLRSRPAAIQAGLGLVVVVLVTGAGWFGQEAWDYTQHDNAFCTTCHVMAEPFDRFRRSEHSRLLCHDCHRQSIFASARQVYLWVAERPREIGPHAPVSNRVCAECHVREDPDSAWQRIASTAGHRVHLESDSSALDDVMCVTCHGEEVHRFVPASRTCGQAGCHAERDTRVVLGAMAASQTTFHCLNCHEFTAPARERAPLDTARTALSPSREECLACHEMEDRLSPTAAGEDPHGPGCGQCHDPHTQERPSAAFATCTGAGCHASPDTLTPFHRGLAPGRLEDCAACHDAHAWEVDGRDCAACHADVPGAAPGAETPAGHPSTGAAGAEPAAPAVHEAIPGTRHPAEGTGTGPS